MTKYTVAIRSTDAADEARSTDELDDALDWFTNAATEVMDDESPVTFASLAVNGVQCGMIEEPGMAPEGGEVVRLRQRA